MKTILLVEREKNAAEILSKQITQFGYSLVVARSGESAVESAATENSIDLILMGILLGDGIDGAEAARRILERRDVPIVFHSSLVEEEIFDKVRAIKHYGFVVSNSGEFVLKSSIELALDLFKANEKLRDELLERKQTEEALRESEEKQRILFMNSPDSYLILQDGIFIDCNRATELMLGGDRTKVIGRSPGDLSPDFQPDGKKSSDAARGRIEEALRRGLRTFEWVHRRFDGSDFIVEVSIASMMFNGKPALFTTWRDITLRKKAEDELRESQRFLSDIVENNGALIYVKDREGKYELVNKKWEESTGLKREMIMGKHDEDLFPGAVGNKLRGTDLRVMELGRVQEFEEAFEHTSGQRFFISIKFPLRDMNEAVKGVCGISTEITQRKQVEMALQESEQSFRTLADSGQALIWLARTDKLCIWFNSVWLKFTGRTHEQEWGNGWAEGVHPDDLQRCLDIYVGSFDRRESFSMEYRLRRHDGEYRWLLDEGCPRYDSKGEFIGYIGHCLDITERKRAEEERERSIMELQNALEQIKTLRGIVPICAGCKKIRDDKGYWEQVDAYVSKHTEAQFTHGVCPDCAKKLYPEFYKEEFFRE